MSVQNELRPLSLKDAPALIESVFPAQKVSFEAQRERKAGAGQTLTALGSYWKGRKPLILVRAILLGCLLPQTDDPQKDLAIYEALLRFDLEGLGRRAVTQNKLKPADIARLIRLADPWTYFSCRGAEEPDKYEDLTFPLDAEEHGIRIVWRRDVTDEDKARVYSMALANLPTYEERSLLCKRPEEVDPDFLYAPVWPMVNDHLGHLGVNANSMPELIEQLGVLRYGHRPKVGDTFCGGGSIPFEAARMGCDVYASDLNPIACMLTWGALNIIGAPPERREELEKVQKEVAAAVDDEITKLKIEHDEEGNRAKAYLYCLETRCPDTGWMVPLAPSWVISRTHNVIAKLVPNQENKRFDIEVVTGVSAEKMAMAANGTVRDGSMVYILNGRVYSTPISTIRGDYRDEDGSRKNRLRKWEIYDFKPRPGDIFQERLYCIQWITAESLNKPQKVTFFASVTEADLERERKVESIVRENLAEWQQQGLVPDMAIEPGYNTDQPIRERGWTYWHHLFNARQLMIYSFVGKEIKSEVIPSLSVGLASGINWNARLSMWHNADKGREGPQHVFTNQALNTMFNYGCRSYYSNKKFLFPKYSSHRVKSTSEIINQSAPDVKGEPEIWITDPPYADAVHYHEITEFFIAWLRKNPPAPFNEWTWDSRRALAIKGRGDDFRRDMIAAYKAMADHMPENGMQCVMFTHQDQKVWGDMVNIFWAAGLQVVAAWYIATETSSELKKGGYVQGTVTLILRKRPAGQHVGFKQRIMPMVRAEVERQIKQMLHLNEEAEGLMGEPIFNDADLQMAGNAAALKVLTGFTHLGDTDVTVMAMRPRANGEVTVVDEIVEQAQETANNLLVPDGLPRDVWAAINGIQRFYLRMLDMETTGAAKLDNYQNFAKAFRVSDYTKVMKSLTANKAALKQPEMFSSRDLGRSSEIGPTWLGAIIVAIQQLLRDVEPKVVIQQLQEDVPEFLDYRDKLEAIACYLSVKCKASTTREASEILANRLRNVMALGQDR